MTKFNFLGPIRLFVVTIFLLTGGILHAQNLTKDEAAIDKQVDAMVYSWNYHNYDDLKNYTTENTDWVNVVGMWWKGRKESQYAHQVYHNTIFKTSVMEKKSVAIRFITADVAIAHVTLHFYDSDPNPPPLPDGKIPGPTNTIATLVFVKENGEWLMTAGANIMIDKVAQQYDPILHMPKN